MSSYDQPEEFISMDQFRESMRLVRLQIAVPISVLIALGTSLVCALIANPGIGGISKLNPTILTPNSGLFAAYWAVLFALQIGFCLLLIVARTEQTKEVLIHGVGLRFAIANWLMAGWAVCWTLQFFFAGEILILLNVVNMLSVFITMQRFPSTFKHPMDTIFINLTITLYFAILFNLMWMHNGYMALGWIITADKLKDRTKLPNRWTWPAVGCVAGVNAVTAIWEGATQHYSLAVASEYILFSLMHSNLRVPATGQLVPKPGPLIITIIVCLCVHPLCLAVGMIARRSRNREGRIRLQDEVEEAEERARHAEAEAAAVRARAEDASAV